MIEIPDLDDSSLSQLKSLQKSPSFNYNPNPNQNENHILNQNQSQIENQNENQPTNVDSILSPTHHNLNSYPHSNFDSNHSNSINQNQNNLNSNHDPGFDTNSLDPNHKNQIDSNHNRINSIDQIQYLSNRLNFSISLDQPSSNPNPNSNQIDTQTMNNTQIPNNITQKSEKDDMSSKQIINQIDISHDSKSGQNSTIPSKDSFGRDSFNKNTLDAYYQLSSSSTIDHFHLESSPQLPAMNDSLTKLRFSKGTEFSTIRRGLATDLKTPAEYTLHIIFTQFVRRAEGKLNLCLDYPIDQEPPIDTFLNQGVDPQFDKIVASLGYIARRKPKPVIDSVMFWRKSKSELATLAAIELEKLSAQYKSLNISTKVNETGPRSKRSLSLMRTKSFSKGSNHKRNQSTNSLNISPSTNMNFQKSSFDQFQDDSNKIERRIFEAKKVAINADRKSLASIFILCRVLIEIVKQTSQEVMGEDLNGKLEEIVYTQLKTTDPISTSQSLVRSANWNLFAGLLGYMSEKRFLSVSDRFIAELEKVPGEISNDQDLKLQLLIHGMRYLRLTNYPPEAFEDTAEFILSLSKFYSKCQIETLIFAYSKVLNDLILSLASSLTAETNHPTWVDAIKKIFNKTYSVWKSILARSTDLPATASYPFLGVLLPLNDESYNGWAHCLNLITASLCVSNKDLFCDMWFKILQENSFKLKPKSDTEDKYVFIVCTARLLWTYIYRLPDSLNNTIKKLESLYAMIFHPATTSKKNGWLSLDINLMNALVQLIRIVGYQHLNYVLENFVLKMLKLSFNGSTLEGLSSERVVVIIHSYLAILEDYEAGTKPPFPTNEVLEINVNNVAFSNSCNPSTFSSSNIFNSSQPKLRVEESKRKYSKSEEFQFLAKNSKNATLHEEVCRSFAQLLKLLDSQYGSHFWLSETNSNNLTTSNPFQVSSGQLSNNGKGGSAFSSFNFGLDFTSQGTKNSHIELFSTLIDAIPWTLVPFSDGTVIGILLKQIVEILTRNAAHPNFKVSSAAVRALKKIASIKNPSSLITMFAKIAFQFTDKPLSNYNVDYINSKEFKRLLKLYVELLNCWLMQFNKISTINKGSNQNPFAQDDEAMNKDVLNDLYQINFKVDELATVNDVNKLKPSDELEWKVMITVIEEVEGNGLFFLCSLDSEVRHYGILILKLVELFDQAIYTITDRSIDSPADINVKSEETKTHSRSSSKFAADIGARLIHILEDVDFFDLIKPYRKKLSVPEKTRLTKLKNRKRILIKLAESDYGIDATIWFRLYPRLLDMFFERCPMPVAMCRSIVCVRMVQMHEQVVEFSNNFKSYTSSLFSKANSAPPEIMINQWKLYLIFACCSLTSVNDQKFSFPTQATHGRKRSMQMFIQNQKITSAKSVFTMVLPLLKSQQPMIRNAVISGLSSMNINIFRTFLENLPACIYEWDYNSKQLDPGEVRLRIEVVHIVSNITSRFKKHDHIYTDEWMLANLVSIIKNVKTFLSQPTIQTNFEFQTLRRYFCIFLESIFISLLDRDILQRWLPFEARIACFNYLKEWCGYADSTDIEHDRYTTMYKLIAKNKDAASIAAKLEVERQALRLSALSCMATICSGPIKQELDVGGNLVMMTFDIPGVMSWIRSLLYASDDKCYEFGKLALRHILDRNLENSDDILEEIVKNCYTSLESLRATESYFTIFAEIFLKLKLLEKPPFDVICLSSFLVGHDSYEVRFAAMKLLKHFEELFFKTTTVDVFSESVCSRTKVVYKKALFEISNHVASLLPEGAFIRVSYMTKFFNLVEEASRRDILSCLLPWMSTIKLKYVTEPIVDENEISDLDAINAKPVSKVDSTVGKQLDEPSLMVLNNLFEITVKFSSKLYNEVEALWVALGSNVHNFDIILDFIMTNCLERKNQAFVEYSRQVIDYLAFSQQEPLYVIDKFINNLHPKSMVPPRPRKVSTITQNDVKFPYVANLSRVIAHNEKDASFSLGQLSLISLVDLFTIRNERMIEKLPTIVHVSISLLDHYIPIVQELAASLLIHLIHALAVKEPKAQETIDILRQRDHFRYLWVYDDLNNDKKGARTPRNMDLLVRNLLEIFSNVTPNLQEDWSRVSLNWATTCAVRHLACRSFQVFRSLLSFLDQFMLKDMLHRLSNTISDDTQDIQGFAMQILMTLNAITAELESDKLIDFPQLFWSSVACLSTIHEQEFIEVLSTMSKFVSKIDLDAPDTISCLISTFPPKWEGRFEGLQQVILVGLRSSNAWDPTLKFLDKLLKFKDSGVIGTGDSRLLMALVASLPRFLNAIDKKTFTKEIELAATSLGKLSDDLNKPALSRILYSFSKNRFRSKNDFLSQTIQTIKALFFPEFEAEVLVLLLGMLSNKIPWVKLETMNVLKQVLPLVDLQRDEFVGVGADLISPLLRLLLTDYAEQALEVLDEKVSISGSQLDKDVLRMSLGNTSMKKEYEKTATLFGIPEDSGWAIPMPVVTAASTRNNVHAVFLTCSVNTVVEDEQEEINNENIQFHLEDYYGKNGPIADHADTVSLTVEEKDASLSNVWAALDDFDSFFTKDASLAEPVNLSILPARREPGVVHAHTNSTDTGYSVNDQNGQMESVPNVYEKDASFILNKSLARTQSNISFKTSLADSIGPTSLTNQGLSSTTRKSYIPFRNSKNLKIRTDGFNSPIVSPQIDNQNQSYMANVTSTPKFGGASTTVMSPESPPSSSEHHTRFENLLGGSRKKSKKPMISNNGNNISNTPDSPSHMYWSSNRSFSPPLNASNPSTPTLQTPKIREKRKPNHKFK